MDPILTDLSRTMIDKVGISSPTGPSETPSTSFKDVFDQTLQTNDAATDKMLEMVDKSFGGNNTMNASPAENIRVEFAQKSQEVGEVGPKKEQFFDLLNDFNQDQNRMDDMLGMMSNKKNMSMQELTACQAAMQKAGLASEMWVRGTELAVRSVQSTVNLQVG